MKKLRLALSGAVLALSPLQLAVAGDSVIVFGLTNASLGQAVLNGNVVTNLSANGLDGVSILLGEADAGVFAYPDTTDNPTGGDYMVARAYGKLNGVSDQLICTVSGRKVDQPTGFGAYPVTLDFSPLGVTNFLAQVFTRLGRLVAQQEIGLVEPVLRTDFNGYKIERVNPFWRTPDGAIAVVLEFPGSTGFELPADPPRPPENPYIPFGTRLVLRALNPTGAVEFVSRVDVTTGGGGSGGGGEEESARVDTENSDGVSTFQMNEMRLGMFGRPHKALGHVALEARSGVLKIAPLVPDHLGPDNDFIEGTGVHIESLNRVNRSAVDFEPVDLSDTNAQFGVTAMVRLAGSVWYFGITPYVLGTARLRHTPSGLTLTGVFEYLGTNAQQVRMAVYRSGKLVGMSPVLELESSLFPPVTVSGSPRVLRAGAQANALEAPAGLGFTFDRPVTFTMTHGGGTVAFEGDEMKFLSVGRIIVEFPLDTQAWIESVDSVLINSRGLTDFTIISEREEQIMPPTLTIVRAGSQVNLSWPDPNRTYFVQISDNLFNGRDMAGAPYPDHTYPIATASDDIVSTNAVRFYRLIHSGTVD